MECRRVPGLRAGVAKGPALASGPFWKAEATSLAGGLGGKEEGRSPSQILA